MTERPADLVDDYCRLTADGASVEVLAELANRMTPEEQMRAFSRLLEEQDRRICMEALSAWRDAGGRWLHS